MASFNRIFFFFFFIITVVLSAQTHARERYFFHKFQRDNAQDKNPSFVPVEATQKKTSVELPPKKDQEQQDQEPSFVPESENGYGLYGHETTYNNNNSNNEEEFNKYEENVNYEPYNTPSLSQADESYNNDKYSNDNDNENSNSNNNNNNNNDNYYNSNAFGRERSRGYSGYNNNNNNNNNEGRQGMSDTRFMENGKYFFDPNDDKNHGDMYKKHYRHKPSYTVSNYIPFGQNNNNNDEQNSFQDPYNSKWEKNMMNEQEQEQEFGEEQQDQFVP